jgi:CheY-like chemotaxis protein
MDGHIDVESEVGTGSTFTVTLPFGLQDATPRRIASAAQLAGLEVTVIDDNATNRQILTRQLESWGCRVTSFDQPLEALAAIVDMTPGLILLDYQMEDMDGLEVCRRLRELEHLTRVPIVLLTSVSFHGRRRELRDAGATGQLTKPVKQATLERSLLLALGVQASNELDGGSGEVKIITDHGVTAALEETRGRVLLVEDNPVNQRVAAALLSRGGYVCQLAESGLEALRALERGSFDLVLMDCQMPLMDGYEATRRIRQDERLAGLPRVPIVAMTANAMEGDREKCIEAGMDDYLAKPVTRQNLYAKLEAWIAVPRPRPRRSA